MVTFGLIQSFKLFAEDADHKITPLVFKVQAKYQHFGKVIEEETIIDLQQFRGVLIETDPLVSALKDIKKAIEKTPSPR